MCTCPKINRYCVTIKTKGYVVLYYSPKEPKVCKECKCTK